MRTLCTVQLTQAHHMTDDLGLTRAHWISSMPCGQLVNSCTVPTRCKLRALQVPPVYLTAAKKRECAIILSETGTMYSQRMSNLSDIMFGLSHIKIQLRKAARSEIKEFQNHFRNPQKLFEPK